MTDIIHEYGAPPSSVSLTYAECEVITIRNELSSMAPDTIDLRLNGHRVYVVHGRGDMPDMYMITPAPGYTASDSVVTVDEGDSATVDICPVALS
jgi:hypothetical protein